MIVQAEADAEKAKLLEYLTLKLGTDPKRLVGDMPYDAFAVIRNGIGVGAVVLTNYRLTSIEIVLAGEPGWISRGDITSMARHIFDGLGVLRVWGCIKATNDASRNLADKLGMRALATLEHEYGPGVDGLLYSMTREQCRWLR